MSILSLTSYSIDFSFLKSTSTQVKSSRLLLEVPIIYLNGSDFERNLKLERPPIATKKAIPKAGTAISVR
jgi:hypothetical protein